MSENLLKYFLICGLPHRALKDIPYNDISKIKPLILSVYSNDGLNEELQQVKSTFSQTKILEKIFPKKFTKDELIEKSQQTKEKKNKSVLENFICKSTVKPEPFFHATQIKVSDEQSWYCSIMIFYESLKYKNEPKKEASTTYIGKALVLISKYQTYYLSKMILTLLLEKIEYSLYKIEC